MPDIDISALRAQLGRKIIEEDVVTAAPLRCMLATFDREERTPGPDEPVPPGGHPRAPHRAGAAE